ncbi:MAG: glycosyltransferase [Propionibacteriales bacterium]|nr:glycosyltransferase [Propionibacteriales bacterium]
MTGPVPISVVVPTVARPQTLHRCLQALLAGTVMPSEVLVIDQGGDAETGRVVDACNNTHDVPVRHITSRRRGLSAARNLGLLRATMPYVAFTDDDCVPSPAWVAAMSRRMTASDAPDGVGGRVLPYGDPAPDTFTLSLRLSTSPAVFRGRSLPWKVGSGGNMILRADTLRRAGGYDERLGAGAPGAAGEDVELVHRLLRSGAVLAFDPAMVVHHDRVGPDRRLATRRSYGFGMGVFAGMWVRHDPWVAGALARWLLNQGVASARAVRHADRWRLHEQRLAVGGAIAGLRYGLRLRSPLTGISAASSVPSSGPTPGDDGIDRQEL